MKKKGAPIINIERCKGCGLCISYCPKKILTSTTSDINSQGVFYTVCTDESQCIACGICAMMCPDTAIEVFEFKKEEVLS